MTLTEITVLKGGERWSAFVGGEQGLQEFGPSMFAAIGTLVFNNPERFGVIVRVNPERPPVPPSAPVRP